MGHNSSSFNFRDYPAPKCPAGIYVSMETRLVFEVAYRALQETAAARFDRAFTGKYNDHEEDLPGKNNAEFTPKVDITPEID